MPDATKRNQEIARAVGKVLRKENLNLKDLQKRVPRGFWEKVRQDMGPDAPETGALRAIWKNKASRQSISEFVDSSFSESRPVRSGVMLEDAAPRQREPYDDRDIEQSVEVDTSMLVNLETEDLVSLGVMADAGENLDNLEITTLESVDLYGRDEMALTETIDIETENWPLSAAMGQMEDTLAAMDKIEGRIQDRLGQGIREMEARLVTLVRSAVQTAVQSAFANQFSSKRRSEDEECPQPTRRAIGETMELRVRVDKILFDLFQTECAAAHHGDASKTMNAVLWRYYGRPRLSFERSKLRVGKAKPKSG
jgi:hypothetical protein